jgi:hypothetical protein
MDKRLRGLLQRFLSGEDRSVQYAEKICTYLIENYAHDHRFGDVIIAFDLYSPSGQKEYGYSTEMVVRECQNLLRLLDDQSAAPSA